MTLTTTNRLTRTNGCSRRLGLVLCLLAAAVGGCKKDLPPKEVAAVNVAVQIIEPLPELHETIRLHGITQPNRIVRVAAEVAGRVEEVLVEEGANIDCGEPNNVIVRLNTDLLQAELDRYRSEAQFNQRDYERLQAAHEKGVATQMEVDLARMKYETARAMERSAATTRERCTIRAPIRGTLNRLPVEKGEYLQPGTPVAEIVDLETIKVAIDVPERHAHFLKLQDRAVVDVTQGQDSSFVGKISYISKLADPSTFTSDVEVSIDNRDGRLRTGKIVDVVLTRRVLKDVILVPLVAVIPRKDDKVVYVVNGNKADRRTVELGLMRGRDVRILSGLSSGDRLIVSGHKYVAPGRTVNVTSTHTGAAAAGALGPADDSTPGLQQPTENDGERP